MNRYPVPARVHRVEETRQKSRFITTLAHAPDAEAAHAFVAAVRDEMPDATHHCWAFVAGPPGSTAHIGMSDDGEPHGTAGRPMLTALLHGGVGDVVAVCTRYYGGVKLGTGGLGRAYGSGVVTALDSLPTAERVDRVPFQVVVGYPDVDGVQKLVSDMEIPILDEDFGADVRITLDVPTDEVEVLRTRITDLTRGRARVQKVG